ncbi:PREDICTED: nuclear apoptosis-inducing factor 1-like [Rhagoletis zephyria]|uniref:nuclear apoptosis-inducing factor 1-like n=1 Tax=Rhagoletis zephyria TaxID=28612 RepID=UPI0008119B3F|nr:PREDICTED: nuclear apoptosis-inducing factor 1-like [Rhagoletis zephyria]
MEGSARKTLTKTTTTQFEVLVKEMERNPDLARGVAVFGSDRGRVEERWEEIMRKINSHGPPTRTAVEWKKIWADLKSRTKKKIAENTPSLNATGGGPFRHSPLSEMEQAIDSLVLYLYKFK